ncbi:MAG TPA: aldolase/citrate lyase family protein [Verrucomicrobiae bacterium]|nr:aldolase/citrate lyase family protein [Verrucomicrobiae bacterium]
MAPEKLSGAASKWSNPLKQKLARGEPVIGLVISVNNVEVAAHGAGLGFDFLWIEMEHAPIALETVRNIVLATRGLPAVPLARPPVNELWMAKRLLDAGVLGVIFPFTRTPELARQAVAACRYPPAGLRGSGADLAQARWPAPEGYYDFADENVLVVAVVEDTTGLSHIDEIAATPGIDVLFIGTSDLSFSLGLRGSQEDPRLDEAVARIASAAKRHGKILGRPGRSPEEIKAFQKQGFQFFMTGTELDLMSAGATNLLSPLGRKRWTPDSIGL